MMPPSNEELIHLAKEIYADRISRLGGKERDFRPHAKTAFTAARQFFAQFDEEFPQSARYPSQETETVSEEPKQPSAREMPPPANPTP